MNYVKDTKLKTFILAVGDSFRKSTQLMNIKTIDKDYLIEWLNENIWSENINIDQISRYLIYFSILITSLYFLLPCDWAIRPFVDENLS